jgi:hypothetical protein
MFRASDPTRRPYRPSTCRCCSPGALLTIERSTRMSIANGLRHQTWWKGRVRTPKRTSGGKRVLAERPEGSSGAAHAVRASSLDSRAGPRWEWRGALSSRVVARMTKRRAAAQRSSVGKVNKMRAQEPPPHYGARRVQECRLLPERALGSLEEAAAFLAERGLLTRMPDCALPSLSAPSTRGRPAPPGEASIYGHGRAGSGPFSWPCFLACY